MPTFFTLLWSRLRISRLWQRLHLRAASAAALVTVVVLFLGSVAILPLEEGAPGATITSFPHALWWSVETATTVGYGDMYPVTTGGRIVAGVVMVTSITTFGVITAALATWFVDQAGRDMRRLDKGLHHAEQAAQRELAGQLRAMHQRFDRLEQRLEDRR